MPLGFSEILISFLMAWIQECHLQFMQFLSQVDYIFPTMVSCIAHTSVLIKSALFSGEKSGL